MSKSVLLLLLLLNYYYSIIITQLTQKSLHVRTVFQDLRIAARSLHK